MLTAEQSKVLELADRTGMIRVGDGDICPGIKFRKTPPRVAVCEGHYLWDLPEHGLDKKLFE